jgi:hypothetical protein
MMKATHIGECQICGRKQKLPGDRLSKHGYTKRWGFFSGVCPGAGHQPFEIAKDRIEGAIASATVSREVIREQAKAIRARTDLKGFYNDYANRGYFWREVEFLDGEPTASGDCPVVFIACDGEPFKAPQSAYSQGFYGSGNAAVIAANSRESYCRGHLDARAAELTTYILWQTERLANWTPKPLTPVAA